MKTSRNFFALFLFATVLLMSACEPNMSITPQAGQQPAFNLNQETTPSIRYMLPLSGAVGTPVRLYGQHFSLTASDNQVWFGDTPATAVKAASTRELIVEVPAGARSGAIRIFVNGQNYTGSVFTVTSPD
ncbi:hypothetical protein GCM10023187_12900 [Nibrella viscosa]|uniref:IPT/TIG domain-containing protein n=1 Tax=Nibrella viscosa TaxID=1084524 RepID=A0ABP8K4X9_9BACT